MIVNTDGENMEKEKGEISNKLISGEKFTVTDNVLLSDDLTTCVNEVKIGTTILTSKD